jgi:hypothetical protein
MKIFFTLCLLLLSLNLIADKSNIAINCQEAMTESGPALIVTVGKSKFVIKNQEDTCETDFEYIAPHSDKELPMIAAWPTTDELGVNAKRDFYRVSPSMQEAKYLGSIPVDATLISKNRYRSISQVGGSMYETVYFFDNNQINIETPSKELIILDTQCIYKNKDSNNCKHITGTFDKPICVYNYGNRRILASPSICSDLLPAE